MPRIKLDFEAEPHIRKYYEGLVEKSMKQFDLASKAKEKGFDVSTEVETVPVADLADRTETLIGPMGIAQRYRDCLAEHNGDRIRTIFQIFREIIEQKWCKIESPEKRLEQAIKTGLVLLTEGVVVAPLDGVPEIKISTNLDGSKFVDIYYAGPIRAAGGTATVFPLILGDYGRILLGLDRYKPTQDEIERYVEECNIYNEIMSRQYKLKEEEVRKIIQGCTVCINGEPTEEREVALHRNLQRIPNNRVRGGMCLVISEGIALKARKILQFAKILNLDWSWLEGIIKVEKSDSGKIQLAPLEKFLEGMAAGRPVFSYPSRIGGFRLRYGRARNTGIMGKGVHPATMHLLDEFIAVGTQLKIERPGKAAGICPVDGIEGPIVKLLSGEVLQINSLEEAKQVKNKLDKILFLGDILVSVGDFRHSAHPLVPAGYCEEWFARELEKSLEAFPEEKGQQLKEAIENPKAIGIEKAIELAEKFSLPLAPNALFYYAALQKQELVELIKFLKTGKPFEDGRELENSAEKKALLEKIGCPHKIIGNKIVIAKNNWLALQKTLALDSRKDFEKIISEKQGTIEALNELSGLAIRDKCGTFIGTRMGRPEQSKPRKMIGNPHVLFPIGANGGNTRSINKAIEANKNNPGKIDVQIALFKCPKCRKILESRFCPECRERGVKTKVCPKCSREFKEDKCPSCKGELVSFSTRTINLEELAMHAAKNLGMKMPELVKGVKGIINKNKIPEPLEKGFLRAKYDLHIFRDATIRYEAINAPITHFKPKEICITAEKAKELGYETDIEGKQIENDSQIIELMPQDIIIPESCGEFFLKITRFVDDLLVRFYKAEPCFKYENREQLIGELVLALAPHTSAAIVGRIIGYTKARACFGHPYFHQTKRRNIDGDQDSIMLLMDGLLNFSHSYLPDSRGGRMDAPLVFTIALKPTEIDDEVYNMETCWQYPLELYENGLKIMPPDIKGLERVENRLGKKSQYSGLGYTHKTNEFDAGPKTSKYILLGSMEEKIKSQARLQNKIAAVDGKDALERVMVSHFVPDIIGNTRAFSKQTFRCTNCNARYRRIPLTGQCNQCDRGNIILTIAQGSVRKYLEIAKEIAVTYELGNYLKQRLDLATKEIDSVFKSDKQEQKRLLEFA
ncbi:MAG: DNA polymerase II large subunit [Candidatus ainarchaeum sp.]|nr:DNA polymerase II large subunit [Candidatus ainarchaeum sp.]